MRAELIGGVYLWEPASFSPEPLRQKAAEITPGDLSSLFINNRCMCVCVSVHVTLPAGVKGDLSGGGDSVAMMTAVRSHWTLSLSLCIPPFPSLPLPFLHLPPPPALPRPSSHTLNWK